MPVSLSYVQRSSTRRDLVETIRDPGFWVGIQLNTTRTSAPPDVHTNLTGPVGTDFNENRNGKTPEMGSASLPQIPGVCTFYADSRRTNTYLDLMGRNLNAQQSNKTFTLHASRSQPHISQNENDNWCPQLNLEFPWTGIGWRIPNLTRPKTKNFVIRDRTAIYSSSPFLERLRLLLRDLRFVAFFFLPRRLDFLRRLADFLFGAAFLREARRRLFGAMVPVQRSYFCEGRQRNEPRKRTNTFLWDLRVYIITHFVAPTETGHVIKTTQKSKPTNILKQKNGPQDPSRGRVIRKILNKTTDPIPNKTRTLRVH